MSGHHMDYKDFHHICAVWNSYLKWIISKFKPSQTMVSTVTAIYINHNHYIVGADNIAIDFLSQYPVGDKNGLLNTKRALSF